jgi:hypothetical protein
MGTVWHGEEIDSRGREAYRLAHRASQRPGNRGRSALRHRSGGGLAGLNLPDQTGVRSGIFWRYGQTCLPGRVGERGEIQ